jgi:hypothetical protein
MTPKQEAADRRKQQVARARLIEQAERLEQQHEHQIGAALKLLKPLPDSVERCRFHVRWWLNYIDQSRSSATTKKEDDRYMRALERLRAVSAGYKGDRRISQESR